MRIKWLNRSTISPISVHAGDTITLSYKDKDGIERVVMEQVMDKPCTFDELGVFETKVGMKYGIGGVFMGNK